MVYEIVTLQNLEIKKINDEKKAALAAQFAAEATLRRVHAAQKDDDMPPIEAILAPLEAELKLARQEVVLESYSCMVLSFFHFPLTKYCTQIQMFFTCGLQPPSFSIELINNLVFLQYLLKYFLFLCFINKLSDDLNSLAS